MTIIAGLMHKQADELRSQIARIMPRDAID